MFVLTEKIAPPPRQNQTFSDETVKDAAVKKREEDDRWIQHIIKGLAGTLREP